MNLNDRRNRKSLGQQIDFEKDLDLDQVIPAEYLKEEQETGKEPQDFPVEKSFSIKEEHDYDEHKFYQEPNDASQG